MSSSRRVYWFAGWFVFVCAVSAAHGMKKVEQSEAGPPRPPVPAIETLQLDPPALTLDVTRVPLRSITGEPVAIDALVAGTLVGLRNAHGDTIGLGTLERAEHHTVTLATHASPADIASVTIGETTRGG